MLNAIKRLISRNGGSNRANKDFYLKDGQFYLDGEVYPKSSHFDTGIPAYRLDDLMEQHEVQQLIGRLYQGLPLSQDEFDTLILPLVRNFAAHAHCLPASERSHHRKPLGLLLHSLQVAVYAMNIARSKYFQTGSTPREIRDNEERWHIAAAIGGLLHDVKKPFTDYLIKDDQGNNWDTTQPLAVWLEKNGASRYYLSWLNGRHNEHAKVGPSDLTNFYTDKFRSFMNLHGRTILSDVDLMLMGYAANSTLAPIVLQADKLSATKDESATRVVEQDGSLAGGDHYIFDAMNELLKESVWNVNTPAARVLVIEEHGVFIDMENGGGVLGSKIRQLRYNTTPQDVGGIVHLLKDRGELVPFATLSNGRHVDNWKFKIEFQIATGSVTKEFNLIKLRNPNRLFGGALPTAIKAVLLSVHPEDEPETEKQDKKAPAPKEKAKEAPEPESVPEGDDNTENRPRDFEKLMSDLTSIEGEHQPDLQPQESAEEAAEEPAKPDPAADLAKALSENLAKTKPASEPEPEPVSSEAAPESQTEALAASAAEPEAEVVPDEPRQETVTEQRIETGKAGEPAAPFIAASLGPLSPSALIDTQEKKQLKPVALGLGPAPDPLLPASKTKQADKPATEPEPKAAAPAKKRKKKPRKLSVREEMERDSRQIQREQRQEKRLNSPNEMTPAAIQNQTQLPQQEQKAPRENLSSLLGPTSTPAITKVAKPAKPEKLESAKLGPTPVRSIKEQVSEVVELTPKRKPETRNRPRINRENEQQAKTKQALESMPLAEQLQVYMPEVSGPAIAALAAEVERVISRDVPLGVTFSIADETVRFEPEVLSTEITQQLCAHPCCDTESDGALICTSSIHEAIQSAIRKAQELAASGEDGSEGEIEGITKNVSLRDSEPQPVGSESVYVNADQAIEILVEQFKVGYGDLVEPGYRVQGHFGIANENDTMALIHIKWPHLMVSQLRTRLRNNGHRFVGKELRIEIGK